MDAVIEGMIGAAIGCVVANLYRDRRSIVKWWKWGRHGLSISDLTINSNDPEFMERVKKSRQQVKRENPDMIVLLNGVEVK